MTRPHTSGPWAIVRRTSSSGATPRPLASVSRKCRLGWVSPRSSLEIEETSQVQASAKATCESSFSSRVWRNAAPNASSVFKARSIAAIDRLVYRNIFLVNYFKLFSVEALSKHIPLRNTIK